MQKRRLGRTGLQVSLLGLGTGGPSVLGQRTGLGEDGAIRLVRQALDSGINFIDSAEAYDQSEAILGRALRGIPRESFIIATKFLYQEGSGDDAKSDNTVITPEKLHAKLDGSLRRLGLDHVDVYQAHGLQPAHYDEVVDTLLPELQRLRQAGKIRFIGFTETARRDHQHVVAMRAVASGHFDTAMIGYNLLNQNADRTVFPLAEQKDVGIVVMVAVRRAMSRPARLAEVVADLKARGRIGGQDVPDADPLGWLVHGDTESVPAAAYRFAIEPAAVSTVLTGTSSAGHLRANIRAVDAGPLPPADRDRVRRVFGHIEEGLGD